MNSDNKTNCKKIGGREIVWPRDYLSPVTYVPNHAYGDASHPDCERGVLIDIGETGAKVLYCKPRTVQTTYYSDLVWG